MNRYMLCMLLCMNFSNALCHKGKPDYSIQVTRRNKPHSLKELLEIANDILKAEKAAKEDAAKNNWSPEALKELHRVYRKKLHTVVNLMDEAQKTERARAHSVPAERSTIKMPQPKRPKSAPNLNN